jgi:PAS domain S-box-containing protein
MQFEVHMKHSKELFLSFIELLDTPAWVKDMAGVYIHVNRAFADFMDMPIGDIIGKTDREILPLTVAESIQESDQEVIRTQQPVRFEENAPGSTGEQAFFRSSKTVITTAEGSVVYIVGVTGNTGRLQEADQEIAMLKEKQKDNEAALRVLLDLRERDKTTFESRTADALTESVLPYLYKLQQGCLDAVQALLLDTVIENVRSLMASHSLGMANIFLRLTPTEMQIAELVRKGLTGKEIAVQLSLSLATVNTHRRNMRKRLGLNKKKINLRQFLLAQ